LAPQYFIRELYELSKRSTLFLIGIANSIDVSKCLGMFDCENIIFENYNGNDVVEIFTARVGELIEPKYIDVLQKKVVKDSVYLIILLNITCLRCFFGLLANNMNIYRGYSKIFKCSEYSAGDCREKSDRRRSYVLFFFFIL
jgi:hypothetical protein